MKTSERGKALIKEFEGLRLEAYYCSAGKKTIGYGHLVKNGVPDVITKEQAEKYFESDIEDCEVSLRNILGTHVKTTQGQFDAFVSFVFNLGAGRFMTSTLLRRHMAGDYEATAKEFLRWNKATVKGVLKAVDGLTRRRKAEQKLYLEG